MQVNAETLQRKIEQLEYWGTCYELTDKERYRLKAYKMLLDYMDRYAELQERYDLDVNPEGK